MTEFEANLEDVRGRILAAAEASHRDPKEIALIAVSKRHPRERILEAMQAGLADFGENYVQEALEKFPIDGARLHFIGPLQRNKIRKILPLAHLVHGVASASVLEAIDRIAGELGLVSRVLLQLHLTGEATKNGLSEDEFQALLPDLAALHHVEVCGLMCMAPLEGGLEAARPVFSRARMLLASLRTAVPSAKELSMGMSGDLEAAIAEGSTMIRVGTSLFGARPSKAA